MIRIYVAAPLCRGAGVLATEGQARYLGSVMRRGVGDRLLLFNGCDGEWEARIAALDRGQASFIADRQVRQQAPDADLWLMFAALKRDATDLLVQKATELGVAALWPVFTERTNAARVNHERLRAIAIEAAEQSERLTLPVLHPALPLAKALSGWPAARKLFVAMERADAGGLRPAAGPAGLLIGPEGGFSSQDRSVLDSFDFVSLVSLGSRILRAETAAIAGLALLQAPGCG